jgi:hypothetical protein
VQRVGEAVLHLGSKVSQSSAARGARRGRPRAHEQVVVGVEPLAAPSATKSSKVERVLDRPAPVVPLADALRDQHLPGLEVAGAELDPQRAHP